MIETFYLNKLLTEKKEVFAQYNIYVVVQFYPSFNFYFLLFLGMVMYDNEFENKENKN